MREGPPGNLAFGQVPWSADPFGASFVLDDAGLCGWYREFTFNRRCWDVGTLDWYRDFAFTALCFKIWLTAPCSLQRGMSAILEAGANATVAGCHPTLPSMNAFFACV